MAQTGFFGKRSDTPKPESTTTPAAATPASPLSSSASTAASSTAKPAGFFGGTPATNTPAPSFASANASADKASNTSEPETKESKLTVGPNIKLKGVEITDCDVLFIEGVVEATLDSKVIQISEKGSFNGTANIDVAEIHGTFDGDLTVREKLTVFATGKVTGKIRYGKLVVEEGGNLSGEISSTGN
ncbi:polymer-forming cytoskeletal protein [Lampropedia puyangensis]|uniref:Polymer-forming cytoskeletal protein n=1 Tax=Lampropedia puyangensis TaxID=1330072 RepID=A0A4V6T2S7_9BURK|nr:polymer-forming cytoskeletal protein [Lampropedia puyangensis]THU03676.1 polymer-forming cytoskeletal protein [Lampropedia puyangensis]